MLVDTSQQELLEAPWRDVGDFGLSFLLVSVGMENSTGFTFTFSLRGLRLILGISVAVDLSLNLELGPRDLAIDGGGDSERISFSSSLLTASPVTAVS